MSSTVYVRFPLRSAAPRERSALLERMLAGAAPAANRAPAGRGNWREEAMPQLLRNGAAVPCLAPLAFLADVGAVSGAGAEGSVFFATPVHCAATMASVRMSPEGILSLAAGESAALARDFERVFQGAERLIAGRSGALYAVFSETLATATRDPGDALDQDVGPYLPSGANGGALLRLMSEIELWLFDHEVNRSRRARALPPITGLWLWGGGAPVQALPPLAGWAAGDDPFFAALPVRRERPADGGSGIVIMPDSPGSSGWREGETRWLAPVLEDLAKGRLAAVELSAGERCFQVQRGWRWRLWRRARPWWEWFE